MIASWHRMAVHGVKNEKLGYLYTTISRYFSADWWLKENAAEVLL